MVSPDMVNGAFEMGGAVMLLLNIRALIRDKKVAGIHWGPTAFWTLWGGWNLFYYPALEQWWSFAGGLAVVTANTTWVALAFRYARRETADAAN